MVMENDVMKPVRGMFITCELSKACEFPNLKPGRWYTP